jgi:hypothetical protein
MAINAREEKLGVVQSFSTAPFSNKKKQTKRSTRNGSQTLCACYVKAKKRSHTV